MARVARDPRRSSGEKGTRRCMGTLVLDDLVDDPRVGGAREAPGDSGRGREDARQQQPPPAADPGEHQHADREDNRRRTR